MNIQKKLAAMLALTMTVGITALPAMAADTVVDPSTNITVDFQEKTDVTPKSYDIIIKSTDGKDINRLTSAELKFAIKQLPDDNGKTGKVAYEIVNTDHVNIIPGENGEYEFNLDGIGDISDKSGPAVTIGTVRFNGYGKFGFAAISGDDVKVNTTKAADNIVDTYTATGEGGGTLTVNSATNAEEIDVNGASVITGEIKPITHNLTIKIAFNNIIDPQPEAYQDMTVTISGGDITPDTANDHIFKLADQTTEGGAVYWDNEAKTYTVTDTLTENIAYNVKVEGAGYRTAYHTVQMTEDKTINFWNNVKDTADVIETGKTAMKSNFLAGEIVKDDEINIFDLSAVVSYFGTERLVSEHPEYAKYDLNRDGVIDSKDVAYVLVSWKN
ncbi:MAG: hypothetical protein J6N52_04380 [Clostridia bacterium]|nr:hypothetical protein [Clostridia bacterium]